MMVITHLLTILFFVAGSSTLASLISIRGHPQVQNLPSSLALNWNVYSFENNFLELVDNKNQEIAEDEGWVNPTSFDQLFLPSDLPIPLARPAIGIGIANGAVRYLMPSMFLTLETPARVWRNRGLCSLPRANTWIDLFAPYAPPLASLKLSFYGQSIPNVRFLEDQDGSAAWESLLNPFESPFDCNIEEAVTLIKEFIKKDDNNKFSEGYHFIDFPLTQAGKYMKLPRMRIKGFLSDFTETSRFLEIEDQTLLEREPMGFLDISVATTAPGGTSDYLPEVKYL